MITDVTLGGALFAFGSLFCLDLVYGAYTIALVERKEHKAGALAGVLIVLSGGAAIAYVNNPWLLIPAAFGGYMGTWLSVNLDRRSSSAPTR
jgi:hypothetical protein